MAVMSLKLFCLPTMRKMIIILTYEDGSIMYRCSMYTDPYNI
jgi:hypothetical protein